MTQTPSRSNPSKSFRRDGWTAKRQLAFLDELARSGRISIAARAAGMSRESAYRLRARDPGGLFAAAWDRALKKHALSKSESKMTVEVNGHKSVTLAASRKCLDRRKTGGIPWKSIKGHNLYDPLFSGPPPSTS
jgi:hypothetical protein